MAMLIKSEECIDCGACVDSCPNKAIYPGNEKYELLGKNYDALSDKHYIVPDKCTECVGFYDSPQCVPQCPVECIIKDPNKVETKEQLLAKKKKLHGE
jgi:ferredoxin